MVLNPTSKRALSNVMRARTTAKPAAAPAAEPYTPTPVMKRVDDLNRSVLQASLSQAEDDFSIHRLMFEPVANVRRPREVVR